MPWGWAQLGLSICNTLNMATPWSLGLLTWWHPQGIMVAQGFQKIRQTLHDLLWLKLKSFITPLLSYSIGQKATSPPGFKRRKHRSSIFYEGNVKEFVTMFENHPTLEQENQFILFHFHQLMSGFPKSEWEKWSLQQVEIYLGRLVTFAVGVSGWERKVWAFSGTLQCLTM